MPADFEYNIDHQMVDMAAWDHVSIDDLLDCFQRLAALPGDLKGSVEYLDLSEASALSVNAAGAVQLGKVYEELLARGLRGIVVFAPAEEVAGTAGMILSTLAEMIGDLPDGFYVIRAPVPPADVRRYLSRGPTGHGIALSS